MINEFFYAAIKFVWRQNLCDKTLAVILLKKFGSCSWAQRERRFTFLPRLLLSFDIYFRGEFFPSSLHFILPSFPLVKFIVTNKFNYKFLSFPIYSRAKSVNEADCKKLLCARFLFSLFMCLWHLAKRSHQLPPEITEIKFNVSLQLNSQLQTVFQCFIGEIINSM